MTPYTHLNIPDDLEPLFNETPGSVRRAEREAIRTAFAVGDDSLLAQRIISYITKYSAAGPLHEQFYLFYEVELAVRRGEEAAHICCLAERALELTQAPDAIPDCRAGKYTYTEIELLLILIIYGHESWREFEKQEICLLKIIQYARLYFKDEKCENIENRAWQILLTDSPGDVT